MLALIVLINFLFSLLIRICLFKCFCNICLLKVSCSYFLWPPKLTLCTLLCSLFHKFFIFLIFDFIKHLLFKTSLLSIPFSPLNSNVLLKPTNLYPGMWCVWILSHREMQAAKSFYFSHGEYVRGILSIMSSFLKQFLPWWSSFFVLP